MATAGCRQITLLYFDNILAEQEKYFPFPYRRLNLRDIGGSRLFCTGSARRKIAGRIRNQRGIYLLGSGDYHYVAYLLMRQITRPFTLVLFDHHADLSRPQRTTCSPVAPG